MYKVLIVLVILSVNSFADVKCVSSGEEIVLKQYSQSLSYIYTAKANIEAPNCFESDPFFNADLSCRKVMSSLGVAKIGDRVSRYVCKIMDTPNEVATVYSIVGLEGILMEIKAKTASGCNLKMSMICEEI